MEEYIHAFLTVGAGSHYNVWRALRDDRDAVERRQHCAVPRIELTMSVFAGSKLVIAYASETWVLKETVIQKLLVFERRILRRIFGPTKENQIWRAKTNEELDKLIFFLWRCNPTRVMVSSFLRFF